MILRLSTANENVRRGDPHAEGKPACRPSPLTGHCDGARAGTGPAPTDGRAYFVTVGALRIGRSPSQDPVGAPPVGALAPSPFTSWHPADVRESGIFIGVPHAPWGVHL